MKKYFNYTLKIAIFTIIICFGVSSAFAGGKKIGEAVVKIKSNANVYSIAESLEATIADSIPSKRTFLFRFSKDRPVEDVVAQLNSDGNVELASSNVLIDLPEVFQISQGFPDESVPIFNKGVSPIDYYAQAGSYNIGIDSAQLFSTGKEIIVAVIDNGIDYSHPLFQNSTILIGHDFITNTADASEQEGSILGHGTFVTGLLLLTAPDVSIIPLRAFNGEGVGDQFNVAKAIDWAVIHGANVINMSFGTNEMIDALQEAIDDAISNNVVLIAASGNEGSSEPHYPAAHPDVISVASVDTLEYLADFSNKGDYIDLVAPGVNLYSTLAGEYDWGLWSGTSFSAPIISGTVALMKQINNSYTPAEVKDHLQNTSRTELLWGTIEIPSSSYGYGIINCYNAVSQLTIGDLDGSGERDITDLTIMIDYISNKNASNSNSAKFQQRTGYIVTDELIDLDCNGKGNMSDVAIMVHHLFVNWHDFKPCYLSK